jgi:hypothetical protein
METLAFPALPMSARNIAFGLLVIIGLLVLGGFFLNPYDAAQQARIPKTFELPQTALLIVFTLVMVATAVTTPALNAFAPLSICIAIGVTLGFLGDLAMADVFKLGAPNYVMLGMGAFAVGHVLYSAGFWEIARRFELFDLRAYVLAALITWSLAGILWVVLVRQPDGGVLQYIALGYALFLASMSAFALGLAFQNPTFYPLAVGAALFMFSDTLIAAKLFSGRTFPYHGDVVWVTYIVAQILIVSVVPIALQSLQ